MSAEFPLLFAEGMLAFISPCLLPMLPIYLAYLTAEDGKGRLSGALAFVAGFTLVFTAMGAGASAIGSLFAAHQTLLERASGVVIMLFGLHFMDIVNIRPLNLEFRANFAPERRGIAGAFIFGCAFSLGWTPCLGPMLASALMLAASAETLMRGVLCLVVFSAGLAVPYILCALFLPRLTGILGIFRRHANAVKKISGALLFIAGLAMAAGNFGYWQGLFSY